MKLTFLHAKNFLSFKDMCLSFKDQIIIVGPNNVGKSNLIHALKFAGDICRYSFEGEVEAFTHKYGGEKDFELEIGFCLDEEEREDLNSFTEIYIDTQLENIRIEDNDIRNLPTQSNISNQETVDRVHLSKVFEEASKELMLLISRSTIRPCSIVIQNNGDPAGVPQVDHIKIMLDLDIPDHDINKYECELTNNFFYRSKPNPIPEPNPIPGYDLKGWFLEFLKSNKNIFDAYKEKDKKIRIKPEEWLKFILEKGRLSLGCSAIDQIEVGHKSEMNKLLRKYPTKNSQGINLYFLIPRMFASRIVILDEVRARPTQYFEDEKFKKEMIGCSPRIYYGTGENLAIFLLKLKNSKVKAERGNYRKIREWFNEFTDGLEFEISYEQENEGKQHRLNIWIVDQKYQMSIDYVGSGLLEALNIFAVLAGNEHCLIALDEPALHLHPVKQHELMKMLAEVIRAEAIRPTGNQFIIITHSPHIIDADSLKNVVRFNLEENETKRYSLAELFNKENEENIKKKFLQNLEYKYIPFARGVIIAEGDCEEIGIRMLLKKMGFDLEKYDIEFFNARGDKGFKSPIKVADALHVPYVVVCDSKALLNNDNGDFKSKIGKALQGKMGEEDKNKIKTIISDVKSGKMCKQDARKKISDIVKKYNVFAFDEEDFVDFLKKELKVACQRAGNEIKDGRGYKLENTIKIIEETTENEVKQASRIKEFKKFLEKKFHIKNDT